MSSSSLTDADADKIAQAIRKVLGITRVSIDSVQLYTALIVARVINPLVLIEPFTIPPNGMVIATDVIPTDTVHILQQIRFAVEQDHAISYSYSVDNGRVSFEDPNVVQATYDQPITYPEIGAFIAARQQVQLTVTNLTPNPQFITSIDIRGAINKETWDTIEENFFGEIVRAIPGLAK